ncbi:MAG: ATP synthase subunit I [Pseudomonadota bacterium]
MADRDLRKLVISADDPDWLEEAEPPVRQWTRQEVDVLVLKAPRVSMLAVLIAQCAAGLLMAAVWWLIERRFNVVWSALYGMACVVAPGALLAYGMTRQKPGMNAGGVMVGFMVWEFAKILVAAIMLAAAMKVVPHLSWLAFLVAVVVCIKVNWLALLVQGRVKKNVASDNR